MSITCQKCGHKLHTNSFLTREELIERYGYPSHWDIYQALLESRESTKKWKERAIDKEHKYKNNIKRYGKDLAQHIIHKKTKKLLYIAHRVQKELDDLIKE